MKNVGKVGKCILHSTERQDDQHQRNSIIWYIGEQDFLYDRVEQYVDIESGSNDEREQFNFLDAIRNDEFGYVIVWEISWISRRDATLQEFFDLCEKQRRHDSHHGRNCREGQTRHLSVRR